MNIKLELPQLTDLKPRLTVIGVGGAGCNAINNMIAAGLTGVEFVAANTDAQTLEASSAEHRIQLGVNLTEGLGAGANPEIGAAAAEEAIDEIKSQISGSHMVFLAAGMGGGTGTGAISVIARASRELGILTVGVVTKPFQFEGSRRLRMAEAGIDELRQNVDTLIAIPNQNLFRIANEKTTFAEAFLLADQVLYSGVACVVDLIVKEGLINLDFADVRAVMSNMGTAMMGTGEASGERRAILAAEEAIANPLLDDVSLQGARGLLLSITGGPDLTLYEVDEAASRVRKEVDPEANIIVGATFDETLEDRVRVSIVASGMVSSELGAALGGGGESGTGETQDRTQQRSVPVPPPVPGGSGRPAIADVGNLMDPARERGQPRPADAMHPGWSGHASGAGAPMPPESTYSHAHTTDETSQQAYGYPAPQGSTAGPQNTSALWQSAEGVTIEEANAGALPARTAYPAGGHAGNTGAPAHLGADASPAPGRFEPRPTEQIRRRSRMPGLEDFPAVGQKDYYSKRGGGNPESGSDRGGAKERKQGLFQRLTGMGRTPSDSPNLDATGNDDRVTKRNVADDGHGFDRSFAPQSGLRRGAK
ncbi:MAG: cell division protein FtsZ [Filomicrobium sp.]